MQVSVSIVGRTCWQGLFRMPVKDKWSPKLEQDRKRNRVSRGLLSNNHWSSATIALFFRRLLSQGRRDSYDRGWIRKQDCHHWQEPGQATNCKSNWPLSDTPRETELANLWFHFWHGSACVLTWLSLPEKKLKKCTPCWPISFFFLFPFRPSGTRKWRNGKATERQVDSCVQPKNRYVRHDWHLIVSFSFGRAGQERFRYVWTKKALLLTILL